MYDLNVLFYLKKAKKTKAGEAPIYLRITIDGQRSELSIRRSIAPDNWDSASQRARGRSEGPRLLNNYIDEVENNLNRYYNIALQEKESITADILKSKLSGKDIRKRMLVKVFMEHNKLLEQEKGKKYAVKTVARYEHALKHIQNYLKKEYHISDIALTNLDIKFMRKFDIYLQNECNYHPNTVTKYLKILKTVIHTAIAFGYISRNPFQGYSTTYKESNRQFLTLQEINTIESKPIHNERLEKVRDIFIFICYTGISYADLLCLTPYNITKGIDGKNWLTYQRVKTKIRASIPLLPPAQKVIDKYNESPECNVKGILLPTISNQRFNDYLTEIAAICGINKPITAHIGRHSFSVSVTLSQGIPIETVSKMLGHTSLKTTQLYAKVVDTKISKDMSKLEEKFRRMPLVP